MPRKNNGKHANLPNLPGKSGITNRYRPRHAGAYSSQRKDRAADRYGEYRNGTQLTTDRITGAPGPASGNAKES
jgi:hypothetical protein